MANGELLKELKEMSENEEKAIPTKTMNRLILTAMVELYEKIESIKVSQNQCTETIVEAIKPIKKNPLYILGEHIQRNPKFFVMLFVLILLLSNLWFIDEIRYQVLLLLKVPEGIIKFFVHGG